MTTATKALKNKVTEIITSRTMLELVEMFEETNGIKKDRIYTSMVRGWIMDELEARNADAFDAFIDSVEDSPRRFFI